MKLTGFFAVGLLLTCFCNAQGLQNDVYLSPTIKTLKTGEQEVEVQQVLPAPTKGVFFPISGKFPPTPFPPNSELGLPIYFWSEGNYLFDDESLNLPALHEAGISLFDTGSLAAKTKNDASLAMADGPPSPGEEGGTNEGWPTNSFPDAYGNTNGLWLEILTNTVASSSSWLTLHNTVFDESYQLLSKTNLTNNVWSIEQTFLGADSQTILDPVLKLSRSNLFFRARNVSVDSDEDGLPDWYENDVTQTDPFSVDTNNTGIPDGDRDPDNDGWNHLNEFYLGTNPSGFNTPAGPGGFSARLNGGTVTVSWDGSPGAVQNYTIERSLGSGFITLATASSSQTSLSDTNNSVDTTFYRIRANYAAGSSANSTTKLSVFDSALNSPAAVVRGPAGRLYFVPAVIPENTDFFQVYRTARSTVFYPLNSFSYFGSQQSFSTNIPNTNFSLAITGFTNGICQIPTNQAPLFGKYTFGNSLAHSTSGKYSDFTANTFFDTTAIPFLDGTDHIQQNVSFLLRAADAVSPFHFSINYSPYLTLTMPTNYIHSGIYDFIYPGSANQFPPYGRNEFAPFQNNLYFKNYVFLPENLDASGNLATDLGANHLPLHNFPTYNYVTNGVAGAITSNLGGTNSQWIFCNDPGEIGSEPNAIGVYINDFQNYTVGLMADTRNIYGLKILSVKLPNPDNAGFTTLYPGGSLPYIGGPSFFEVEAPILTNVNYYFCQPYTVGNSFYSGDLPGTATFATGSTSTVFYATLRNQMTIAGWAKHRIVNGYTNKFVYAQQYFDKAYLADSSGAITTNQTGVLSEYGDFYPTQAGKTFLTTKPDAYGNRGSAIVYVIGLQADVNRDGEINGMDATTVNSPYVFWVNNDVDRGHIVDGNDFEEDDLLQYSSQLPIWEQLLDYQFTSFVGAQRIPSKRDLEDYTRLWIPGIAALASELPSGYTLELAWNYPQNNTRPTLKVFVAAETNGGSLYLTDNAVAGQQTNTVFAPFYGTVAPSSNAVLNTSSHAIPSEHFIFCGAARGSGPLTVILRSPNGGISTLATLDLQIKDIKEMYERWTVGDERGVAPKNLAIIAQNDLPAGVSAFRYDYGASRDTNTPYIAFVHGWNMKTWEKDRFAEAAFKRLYWQGYRGRFGSFRWPTGNGIKDGVAGYVQTAFDRRNYDNSEFNAWRSATGLKNRLVALNILYPEKVYLLAHSMGNVAAGEALRLAANQVVNTYVASQAAVPSHTYDGSISNYSFSYPPFNFGPITPNIYSNWFTASIGAGRRINFYNANDYALARGFWELGQLLKPDQATSLGWSYVFSGYPNDGLQHYTPGAPDDTPPWNHFLKDSFSSTVTFNIVNSLHDRYEVMAYAAQSRSSALGRTPNVQNLTGNVNLARIDDPRIWPPDSQDQSPEEYSRHKWHSAQFRSTNMKQQGYWRALLSEQDGFDLEQP